MNEYSLRAKITAKDKVTFEDDSLNTGLEQSVYENLDQMYALDGKFRIKRYSNWIMDLGLENELFEVKVTDINTGEKHGSIKAFFPNKVLKSVYSNIR